MAPAVGLLFKNLGKSNRRMSISAHDLYIAFVTQSRLELECLRLYGQANKRMWWMPRRQKAMKDVVACEKPRGAGKQALIRGCPNGETRP